VEDLQEAGVVGADFKLGVGVDNPGARGGRLVEIGGSRRGGSNGCGRGEHGGLRGRKRGWLGRGLWRRGLLIWLRALAVRAAAEQAVVAILSVERVGGEREGQRGGGQYEGEMRMAHL